MKKEIKNKKDCAWLILPLIAFTTYSNGTKEITFGWLTKTISFLFK